MSYNHIKFQLDWSASLWVGEIFLGLENGEKQRNFNLSIYILRLSSTSAEGL